MEAIVHRHGKRADVTHHTNLGQMGVFGASSTFVEAIERPGKTPDGSEVFTEAKKSTGDVALVGAEIRKPAT